MITIQRIRQLYASERFRKLFLDSWKLGWPLIIIMLFEFAVSLTDVYVAGKISKDTQAAVGFVSQVYFVFIVIANALTMGTVSVVSRLHGSGEKKEFKDAVYTLVVSVLVSGIILSVLAVILAPFFISHTDIPLDVKIISVPFIKYYLFGLVFHYIIIHSNGILRSIKRVKRSLATMTIVAIINVGLNLSFLNYTDLGFRGIALSTVASYIAGAFVCVPVILRLIAGEKNFSKEILLRVIRIGLPSLFQQISWQAGTVVLFIIVAMLPGNSVDVMAGFTTGLRIEAAIFLPAYALNMTAATISGNLLGEKKKDDAYVSGLLIAFLAMIVIILLSITVIVNARSLADLMSDKPMVVHECVRYLIIQMISEPFMAVLVVLSGMMSGAGDTFGVMRIVVSGMWLIRIPFAYVLGIKLGWGPVAVWWVMNTDILIRMIFTVFRYKSRKWMNKF